MGISKIIAYIIIVFGLIVVLNNKLNLHISFLQFDSAVQWIIMIAVVVSFIALLFSGGSFARKK